MADNIRITDEGVVIRKSFATWAGEKTEVTSARLDASKRLEISIPRNGMLLDRRDKSEKIAIAQLVSADGRLCVRFVHHGATFNRALATYEGRMLDQTAVNIRCARYHDRVYRLGVGGMLLGLSDSLLQLAHVAVDTE
jgi:hypothetical protein